jgi:predicted transcriptional regulator
MKPRIEAENERAARIAYRINEYHSLLANIYENLVDRDFKVVRKETQVLITELRFVLKSTEEDDF